MSSPRWSRGERFERVARFEVQGKPAEIFPLLCPVREYDWIPDWSCTMNYSESGVAEKNAVFRTDHLFGVKSVVWYCITYEPDTFIEYLMVSGRDGVVRLSIGLAQKDDRKAEVTWAMVFTATSWAGRRIGRRQFSEAAFTEMMRSRQAQLDHYLLSGTAVSGGPHGH